MAETDETNVKISRDFVLVDVTIRGDDHLRVTALRRTGNGGLRLSFDAFLEGNRLVIRPGQTADGKTIELVS